MTSLKAGFLVNRRFTMREAVIAGLSLVYVTTHFGPDPPVHDHDDREGGVKIRCIGKEARLARTRASDAMRRCFRCWNGLRWRRLRAARTIRDVVTCFPMGITTERPWD